MAPPNCCNSLRSAKGSLISRKVAIFGRKVESHRRSKEFKIPDFNKYKGNFCPRNHLISYCRKMASHTHDDKLLIHLFQEILTRVAYSWYLNLEKRQIRTWKDLTKAFLKQYKYNEELALDRTQLQNMAKKETKTFKEYA
ncbi:hypothetical protein CR513_42033, partial [Mucuna pruriens]